MKERPLLSGNATLLPATVSTELLGAMLPDQSSSISYVRIAAPAMIVDAGMQDLAALCEAVFP